MTSIVVTQSEACPTSREVNCGARGDCWNANVANVTYRKHWGCPICRHSTANVTIQSVVIQTDADPNAVLRTLAGETRRQVPGAA